MKILGVIPARFASTRFPGKPLVMIGDKTMIERVYNQTKNSKKLDDVVVATDDDRIYKHVLDFGGKVIMTAENHQSGTDRCAEVALNYPDADVIINIQGDEPFIDSDQIDLLCTCFENPETQIATLIRPITDHAILASVNSPKVVINAKNEALYFSRSVIPFLRNHAEENWLTYFPFYQHIGIYGYRKEILKAISNLKPSSLELAENLEQLRWLENGYKIRTSISDHISIAIDTPEDLKNIEQYL